VINWIVSELNEQGESWYFPSFEIQEYLLPIINVGVERIDEYGSTEYSIEDCRRLKYVIVFALETLAITQKSEIRYETIHDDLVPLNKQEIIDTLESLLDASKLSVKLQSELIFMGD
jgi:hypothetical protein